MRAWNWNGKSLIYKFIYKLCLSPNLIISYHLTSNYIYHLSCECHFGSNYHPTIILSLFMETITYPSSSPTISISCLNFLKKFMWQLQSSWRTLEIEEKNYTRYIQQEAMNVIDIEMPKSSTRNLNYVTSLTEYLQLLPSQLRPHQRPDKSGIRSQHLTS